MAIPAPAPSSDATATPTPTPAGVRIASTLCWIVGVVTILVALATGIPALPASSAVLYLAVNLVAGGAVCVAAVLIRRQRRVGVLVMILAWALPTLVVVLTHGSPQGSFLLFVALLFVGANWKHFK
jgi:hypothetical protein